LSLDRSAWTWRHRQRSRVRRSFDRADRLAPGGVA
jgi:hypothetical protein